MNITENSTAFGAPGIEPRWTSSAKEGFGTAYHTSCRLWFTLSHGIVNEIYYPSVDQPNTRDFQYLISDGETFCHEEKSDLDHEMEYPEKGCLFYRLTNSERNGRYRVIKHILTDPHRSVLLIRTKLEIHGQNAAGQTAALRAAGAAHGTLRRGQFRPPHGNQREQTAARATGQFSPGHGMHDAFFADVGRLRRRQRRLAGFAQFQNGLGVRLGRKRQYRIDRRDRPAAGRRIHGGHCPGPKLSERGGQVVAIAGGPF